MNIIEKLNRIKAKCEQPLAIAEKRTPGKWKDHPETLSNGRAFNTINSEESFVTHVCGTTHVHEDAAFIAACAGPAEAGWRATIAAIDGILPMLYAPQVESSNEYLECCEHYSNDAMEIAKSIIAAWEGLV